MALKPYLWGVKTTVDLPEEILHRAKVVAAQRKTTLRELIIQGLTYTFRSAATSEEDKRRERADRLITALSRGRNTESVGPLKREEIHDRQEAL